MTLSNAASASLEANPFVGEGGAYASVRPAYPDEAVAALLASARLRGGVTGDIEPAAGDPADSPSVEDTSIVPAPAPASLATVPTSSAPLHVADIGAGTGKMSELLARTGAVVDAVEPSDAMRAQASSVPGVTWHGGVAEDTGLPDGAFDIVVFAQSWHC